MNLPLCIVLLYVVLLFAVSFYVSHKQRNNKESLLLYKGQNNTLIVAASVAGLAIGDASTIGISENAFAAGLSAGWYDTAWAIGAVIAGLFVVDRLRRGNYDTISDLIGDLYGGRTRILMVITMCLIQSGIIALQYKAGGSILAALLPSVFTVQSGTFFSFVIFVLVAAIGGMGSVTLTNVLNIILIYVGVFSATLIVLLQRGGLQAVRAMQAAEPQMHYLSPTAGMGWIGIASWIIVLIGTTSSVQGVAEIVLHGEKAIIPASMVLDGEYGEHGLCAGVPVLLGENGVEEVIEYDLPEEERNQFHQCCDAIRHNMTLDDSVIRNCH